MIGRAVCPMYKETVHFPIHSVTMDFEIEIIPNKSGPMLIQQKYDTLWGQLFGNMVFSKVVLSMVFVLHLVLYRDVEGFAKDLVLGVLPYGAAFYSVRFMADRAMGIEWLPIFRHLP